MKLFNFGRKNDTVQYKQREIEENLKELSFISGAELLDKLETSEAGLTAQQVEDRLEEYGENIILTEKEHGKLYMVKEAFINPFNIVLLLIAVISFFTDIAFSATKDYTTTAIILFLVFISGTIALVQNIRSENAADSLAKMISNTAHVYRERKLVEIPVAEIVPGDIIKFSAGDMIPADVCFLFAKDTFVAQGVLTGESNPVEKFATPGENRDIPLTDLQNLGFMGSNVVSGSATAVAISTANQTYFGAMAKSLTGDRAKTSFERGVDSVSMLLIRLMLIMVPIVFLINGITKQDWLQALLFSITVAVGITPEMLPVIMTSTLAKGAVSMAKQDVIVKSLGSIQAFGEIDILCTDKTGTLTEDKIILEKYMDLAGNDDSRVLKHAFLNSYFQTGLKNLIDVAIISRAETNGLIEVVDNYNRVDEIPFDFSRRRMSVVLVDNKGKRQLITKGAVEEISAICTYADIDGQIVPFTDEIKEKVLKVYEKHNSDGLRMLGVAQKNEVPDEAHFGVKDESEMVLLGFIGFLDPPKESAKKAVAALSEHGVRTIVLTGDSEGVAVKVCKKVGIDTGITLTGADVEKMTDDELKEALKKCNLFSKLSPNQKKRVVKLLQEMGHAVGYMGDGINDAPPIRQADIGISVDTAVDIAKETADIILLKKDLMVLEKGVLEGRKTFGNIIKYIKMAASGNFGNMISVIIASIFLPFLPMLPVQILTQNLLCDFSQMGIPFDDVDKEYLLAPRKWDTKSIEAFIMYLGPVSSVFDILCYLVMWYIMGANSMAMSPLFQCGWFIFGTLSQVLVIHMIRTSKTPFVKSRASMPLILSTVVVAVGAVMIAFTNISTGFGMMPLPLSYIPWLFALLLGYCLTTQLIKKAYIKKFKNWI